MSRIVLALVTTVVLAPMSGAAAPPFTFTPVHVDLPDSETMFPGPGADAINRNCLACHSAGMVLTQPAMPRTAWQSEVEKMIHVYKAPVDDEDAAAIVDYLAHLKSMR
jgi:cytochrome c553